MARVVVKLFSEESKTALDAAVAAYKAGAGTDLADYQRGMAYAMHTNPGDGDRVTSLALAHAGLDTPASGAKTADLQHLLVDDDKLADAQTALDGALADAVHHLAAVTDIDTTTPGTILSAGGTPFTVTDVGRKVAVDGEVRTITGHTSNANVQYDDTAEGALTSGTGKTLDILGAESLQDMQMVTRLDDDGDLRVTMMLAVEGELP